MDVCMTSSAILAADNEWYRLNYQKGVAIIDAKVRCGVLIQLCAEIGVVMVGQCWNKNYYVHSLQFVVEHS